MATIDDVRAIVADLDRAYEVVVRGRVKFRVGQLVFVAFSADETTMGFGFPKLDRPGLVASDPAKFRLPSTSDMRYHWVEARLSAIDDPDELRELVVDAWRMCVPKKVAAEYDRLHPLPVDGLG